MFKRKNLIKLAAVLVLLAATVSMVMALEAGSDKVVASKNLFVAGTEIKAGEYEVKWDANGKDVTFIPSGKAEGIKIQGKVEQLDKKSERSTMRFGTDSAGRDTLKQVQFRGKLIRIVFE